MLEDRRRRTTRAMATVIDPTRRARVLDLGSGDGAVLMSLRPLLPAGSAALGIDLLESRLVAARQVHPDLVVAAANGAALPFPPAAVDVVTVFTVFSSILDAGLAQAVAGEIRRILAPGGAVVWYDMARNNPRNRAVRGLPIAAVRSLFPGWHIDLEPCTVLPPLVRRTEPLIAGSYGVLARIPRLRTHLFGVLRPH